MNFEELINFNGKAHPQILFHTSNSKKQNQSDFLQNQRFTDMIPLDLILNGRFLLAFASCYRRPLFGSIITHLVLLDLTNLQELKHVYKFSDPKLFPCVPSVCYLHDCQSLVFSTRNNPTILQKITLKEILNNQDVTCFEICEPYSQCEYEIIQGDTHIVLEDFHNYAFQVFDCKNSLNKTCVIEGGLIGDFEFDSVCLFDNDSRIAIISWPPKFHTIEISSKSIEMKDFSPLFKDAEEDVNFFINLHNIYLENSRTNHFFAVLDTGRILDINNEKVMTPAYFEQLQNVSETEVVSESHICDFNKYIYIISITEKCLVVFDPFKYQTIYYYELSRNPTGGIIKIDWFGSVAIYSDIDKNDTNTIFVETIFEKKVMSLKYLSRMVLFSTFSYNQLQEMNFSKPLRAVLFDNI